ncbi:MAG: hypothetical protein FJ184_12355 [Gammaproteobacteria bacterium]|nr:hypothetical protein [Gammaproteobacteria bacterium]
MLRKSQLFIVLFSLLSTSSVSAGLITNGSFEAPTGFAVDAQGSMPPSWFVTNMSPDLYSTDGLFGLSPNAFGNFTGVTAQSGLGWVAGWTDVTESFAQNLNTLLTPGLEYQIDGYLRQAVRSDLNNPGAYRILLNSSNSLAGAVEVASWGPTTAGANSWEFRTATFAAPSNADSLPWLIFRPYASGLGGAYPGLDNVVLTAVPEPSSTALVSAILVSLIATRHLRNRRTKR